MKSVSELRRQLVDVWLAAAARLPGGRLVVMEVCGTHTMAIAASGLKSLLPDGLELISGPGCPVCVTDQSYMDQAVWLARQSGVVIATYGDMVRVPGRSGSLAQARADGARVEVVYSARQAVALAKANPQSHVVFLGVGFETTTPATALAVIEAQRGGVSNFSTFTAHKLIMPAMNALMAAGDVRVDAFLCPGHVSVILGWKVYEQIARDHARPCVVGGFEPANILAALIEICRQIAAGAPAAASVYPPVRAEGNAAALKLIFDVFEPADAPWRAIGVIPESGLRLRDEFAQFDTQKRFALPPVESYEMPGCRCGDVICGRCRPSHCPLFAKACTPRDPVGPCMVSAEGACAAAFKYQRR
ncbi:MAG: hydrogenase formation protein HypD [Planctomycetaceae bacterium]|nr:hydrogenase formation protein HypD [Planctomycetaceae bacterium]